MIETSIGLVYYNIERVYFRNTYQRIDPLLARAIA